ncbi:heavy-metal-associated domain-containing protein [Arthrobacter sp. I2-34]|uniref:Heavy-metal-associated domain-containing protein n=1 Tax=Arthrobacter hankyongi TaxID=2904801 RepID=A0ABS9L4N3_9MICC|nr:heavy-metal-associated domain-containing protein [Arthrobacter hankyongi]MCG2621647.1 heavy-metal-associated domain-containing protein [Arthrobacter hankyongi]
MCGSTAPETSLNTAGAAGCSCCGPMQQAGLQIQTAAPVTTIREYLVDGMTCGGCASSVSRAIGRVDGVRDVQVSLVPRGTSTVTVHSTGPVPAEAVRSAVAEAGYKLAGNN